MSLKNSFSFFIVALFSLLLSTEAVVYAQTPREDPTRNSGSFLRQEQELEKRKNLPTQIPKSLLENKDTKKSPAAGEKILVNSFKFEGEIKFISIAWSISIRNTRCMCIKFISKTAMNCV